MNSILVIGGAHIDRKGKMQAPYFKGSSIPGTMTDAIGGGAFNVAINLARLDEPVLFASPRTNDASAIDIKTAIENIHNITDLPINTQGRTPSYTAMIDQDGELIAALADMDLYDDLETSQFLTNELRDTLQSCKILVTDANLPEAVLTKISELISKDTIWYAIATSPAKVIKYKDVLDKITLLAMNKNEAMALTNMDVHTQNTSDFIPQLKIMGLGGAIITDGEAPLACYMTDEAPLEILPPVLTKIVDVTGAGDATIAAFISSILNKAPLKHALENAIAAAQITIGFDGAQNPQLSQTKIKQQLA